MNYPLIISQIKALAEGENNKVGLLANISALLKETGSWHWVGFYLVHDKELWLGPFQGPPACMKIPFGKGVCGTAWEQESTLVVPDVHSFEGHIACSSLSRSELVIPIFKEEKVTAVLDIDSVELDDFKEEDVNCLETICRLIEL